MSFTAGAVARLVNGELVGPDNVELTGVAPLERAGPGELAFLASSRHAPYLRGSGAGAVLMTPEFRSLDAGPRTRIVVPDAERALRAVLTAMYPDPAPAWGIDPSARVGRGTRWDGRIAVGPEAVLGASVRLGADCVVERGATVGDGVRLGHRCRVGPGAVLHPGTVAGDRVVIHGGAQVGGQGFRFTGSGNGTERLPHIGRCLLGDDVEIGANTTIDRGSVSDTVVGAGTKIDNLVQVAHNVRIGERCLIMAQVGIAGSTVIEDDVILAGQAGLAGHLTVHRGARVAAQGGVIGDVAPGATVSGYPARSHREVLRQSAALRRLTPLVQQLERIAQHGDT